MSDPAWVCLIVALAAFIQSVSGFGFALIAVPLLAVVTDPVTAVVLAIIFGCVHSGCYAVVTRRDIEVSAVWLVSVCGLLGMPVGLMAIDLVDPRWLSLGIGIVVLLFSAVIGRGWSAPGRTSAVVAGVASGALLTSTGMNGPPLVIAFSAQRLDPARFRATLQVVLAGQDLIAIAGFALAGLIGTALVTPLAAGLPTLALGWYVGLRSARRIDPVSFHRLVLALLVLSGVLSIAAAVRG